MPRKGTRKGVLPADETGEAPIDDDLEDCRGRHIGDEARKRDCGACENHRACRMPGRERIKAYLDCPTCPLCASRTGIPGRLYDLGDKQLVCAACGQSWDGTPEQVAQAERAQAAWERREDGQPGPRAAVVRRRRRHPIDQLGLFEKKGDGT